MSRRRQERRAMLSSSEDEDPSDDDETAPLTGGDRGGRELFGWAADGVCCAAPLLRLDLSLARSLTTLKKTNKPIGILAEVVSLSGDEAIWFGVGGVGSLLYLLRLCGVLMAEMSCAEETCFELFGGAAVCCLVEQLLKFTFQRSRPPWCPPQKQWVVPAEWLSFPSGHALRAFYLCYLLPDSRLVGAVITTSLTTTVLLPWATLVGLSRVLKGRHFPLDILFGALIGIGLGIHLESHGARREDPNEPLAWYQDDYSESQWAKAVGGILLAVEWGFYYGIPLLARKLAPWILVVLNFLDESWAASHHREARGVAWWIITVLFFGFYGKLFKATMWSPPAGEDPFAPDWECIVGLHKGPLLRPSDPDTGE